MQGAMLQMKLASNAFCPYPLMSSHTLRDSTLRITFPLPPFAPSHKQNQKKQDSCDDPDSRAHPISLFKRHLIDHLNFHFVSLFRTCRY